MRTSNLLRLALPLGLGFSAAALSGTAQAQNCASMDPKDWPAPARPYFMLVVDTSGSMASTAVANSCKTTNGYPSNYANTRIGAVRCALNKTIRAFNGQVNFGLAGFGEVMQGCGANCYTNCSFTGNACAASRILVPIDPDPLAVGNTPNVGSLLDYVDNNCTGSKELWADGNTPLRDSLDNIRTYLGSSLSGFVTPLSATDPTCRAVNIILLTDGEPNCTGNTTATTAAAAATLYNTGVTVGGRNWKVRVHVIDAANAQPSATNTKIATSGGGVAEGATTEDELSRAFSKIISGAISPENCDNVDNNCNGCVDEGYRHYCNRSRLPSNNPTADTQCCNLARSVCLANYASSITAQNPTGNRFWLPCYTPPAAQLAQSLSEPGNWLCVNPGDNCDNVDNNCDGTTPNASTVDENLLKCGGKCPTVEICNGVDDNCNGVIDETSGGGAYSLPNCFKDVPSAEICDGCDNDLDGIADNGIASVDCGVPTPAHCAGKLSCATPQFVGVGKCKAGSPSNQWGTCSNSAVAEVCDGEDNNCDGAIDNGIAPQVCDVPGFAGLNYGPNSQCKQGQRPCGGQCSGWIGPSQEICDGIDNDCDGLLDAQDSDLAGVKQICGSAQGICSKGETACVAGTLICQGGQAPQAELCDGSDNDCNGFVDDGVLADAPSAAQKGCWTLPGNCCSFNASSWCPPAGASCQGLGTLSAPCTTGSLICQAGGWQCLGGFGPSNEVCDGIDNNCDNSIDEGIATSTCGSSVGECKPGVQSCKGGILSCEGSTLPIQEVCDDKDNDCDGVVDNGIVIGNSCSAEYDKVAYPGDRGKGECKPGQSKCGVSGQVVCEGGLGPQPEVCDGRDNDCDGQVDESGDAPNGINGTVNPLDSTQKIGDPCGKSVGMCKLGAYGCSNGQFFCLGGQAPQPEICDCYDNDCDGEVDEDPGSSEQAVCSTGKVCVVYKNSCQCASPCKAGEFPCPTGNFECSSADKSGKTPPESAGKRCVSDPSLLCEDCQSKTVITNGKLECAPEGTVLDSGTKLPVCVCKGQDGCHNPCYHSNCAAPQICTDFGPKAGSCVYDNCWNFPCSGTQVCSGGTCKDNPCKANSCPTGKVCKPKADMTAVLCTESCQGVTCKATDTCQSGICVATGCDKACSSSEVCVASVDAGADSASSSSCVASKCAANTCANGSYCDPATGACGDDPCAAVLCPSGQSCSKGECFGGLLDAGKDVHADGSGGAAGHPANAGDGGTATPDGAAGGVQPQDNIENKGNWGLATGGGGCSCETRAFGTSAPSFGAAVGLLAAFLAAGRRRRKNLNITRGDNSTNVRGFGYRGGRR